MGFFDFLKGKEKNVEQSVPEENIQNEPELSFEQKPEKISRETVEQIVKEVIAEFDSETEELIESDIVEKVIHEVSDIEEEIASEILEEITESVEEIVREVVGELLAETKEQIPDDIVEKVISDVKEIETQINQEIKIENGSFESDEKQEQENLVEQNEAEDFEENSPERKQGFFARLLEGLGKTRKSILDGVDAVLSSFTKIDEDLFEELEEVLIMADIGVETTSSIIENLRKRVKKEKTTDPSAIKNMLVDEITSILNSGSQEVYDIPTPSVILVIGVNGVGKTTTIGKLSSNLKKQGKSVLLGAADTFRAAAIDQLQIWGDRAGLDVIKHEENSDPAAVVFDAVNAAKNRKTDVLICDTAGRLHNKKNLMEELKKISKVISREYPEANKEVYLVLDATTGQNAMQQAKLFKEVAEISGIILTKLDGTAKGGIVIAIKSELQIPVRYIGVGEGIEDLQVFQPRYFAEALFSKEN